MAPILAECSAWLYSFDTMLAFGSNGIPSTVNENLPSNLIITTDHNEIITCISSDQ